MTTLALIIVIGLAASRITRLWRDDLITEPLRSRWENYTQWKIDDLGTFVGPNGAARAPRRRAMLEWVADLLDCSWCISGWITAGLVIATLATTGLSLAAPLLSGFAAWQVAVTAYWLTELLADGNARMQRHSESVIVSFKNELRTRSRGQ